jgi:signal transduction histidine kinase/DNA-binding response OmpR family regulator
MLARVLSKCDTPVDVLTALSGEEALKLVGDSKLDVLITDFMMEGINGLELVEKIKRGREKEPAHTILMTAYDTPGLAIAARGLGVQDYLVKPVQPDKIRDLVGKVIRSRQAATQAPQAAAQVSPVRILIADDYPDNIRLLAVRLKGEGYEYLAAQDGEETLAKIRSEKPDLVLLDVNMPKKDGFEVLAEMRADPEIAHIPVIIITAARIGSKDVRAGLSLGADDYITKPFDWQELIARIRNKLRVKQAEDALRRRNQELGALPELSQELSACAEIDDIPHVILKGMLESLHASQAHLMIFQPDGSQRDQILPAPAADDDQQALIGEELRTLLIATRQPVSIADVHGDERFKATANGKARALIAVPLLGRRDVVGLLALAHDQPTFFKPENLKLMQAISRQASIAIENAQLYSVEHKRVQELVALNQLTHQIHHFTNSSQLLETLPGLIQAALAYPIVTLWHTQAPTQGETSLGLQSAACLNGLPDKEILALAPLQVAASGRPAMLAGALLEQVGDKPKSGEDGVSWNSAEGQDSKKAERAAETPGDGASGYAAIRSAVAVPFFKEKTIAGVLAIHSPNANAFQESDRVVLETLATQLASALERAALFESVEQEQRRLSAVLHSAADAILVFDEQNCLQLANPAGERLFTDIEARTGYELPAEKGYDELVALLLKARHQGGAEESELAWPDGRTFSATVTNIEEGGQVVMLHDVSHFKALDRLKNEFIATASHDLKNPIFAMLGYSDLLKKAGPLNPMQADFVDRIRNAGQRMQELVLNLLEMARMEMGTQLNLEQFDLVDLLQKVLEEFKIQAEMKQQSLADTLPATPLMVMGDRLRLQQVTRNLLGNAIKYTPEGGEIRLLAELANGQVQVKFQDTGIGIPADDLPHIFEKFYRVQTAETEQIEGNGLGLAIVKSIIEQHRGEISVESTPGKGSCFTVRLPSANFPGAVRLSHADKN